MTNRRRLVVVVALALVLAPALLWRLGIVRWPGELPSRAALSTAAPSRVMLGWGNDPANGRAVTWRTETMASTPLGQIAAGSAVPAADAIVRAVPARSTVLDLGGGRQVVEHRVDIDALLPSTRYMYRVGSATAWSEWFGFVTASAEPAPFRFIYFGDAQTGLRDVWPRTVAAAHDRAPDARFAVHAGDLLAEGYDDTLWGDWARAMSVIGPFMPSLPVPGSHDEHRPPASPDSHHELEVSGLWNHRFALPINGPASLGRLAGQNYHVDYQGVRFIALDVAAFASEEFVPSERMRVQTGELAWLSDLLSNNPNRWTIVVQHQPFYAVANDRDYRDMRAALGPLYDRYHVDLVLQGHDHAYARTHKVFADALARPDGPGTVYVISVAGSKMYEISQRHEPLMARLLAGVSTYQIISTSGDRLSYESYGLDVGLIDSFGLTKTGQAPSLYQDRARGPK